VEGAKRESRNSQTAHLSQRSSLIERSSSQLHPIIEQSIIKGAEETPQRINYITSKKSVSVVPVLKSKAYEKGEVDVSGGEINEYIHEPLPTLGKNERQQQQKQTPKTVKVKTQTKQLISLKEIENKKKLVNIDSGSSSGNTSPTHGVLSTELIKCED
jgi:hypothetical protein